MAKSKSLFDQISSSVSGGVNNLVKSAGQTYNNFSNGYSNFVRQQSQNEAAAQQKAVNYAKLVLSAGQNKAQQAEGAVSNYLKTATPIVQSGLKKIGSTVANQPLFDTSLPLGLGLKIKSPTIGQGANFAKEAFIQAPAQFGTGLYLSATGQNQYDPSAPVGSSPILNAEQNTLKFLLGNKPVKNIQGQGTDMSQKMQQFGVPSTVANKLGTPTVIGLGLTNFISGGGAKDKGLQDAIQLAKKSQTVEEFASALSKTKSATNKAIQTIIQDSKNPINSVEDFFNTVKNTNPVGEMIKEEMNRFVSMRPHQPAKLKTSVATIPTEQLYAKLQGSSRFKDAYRKELEFRGLNPDVQDGATQERGLIESIRQNENNRDAVRAGVKSTYDTTTDAGRIKYGEDFIQNSPTEADRIIASNEPLTNESLGIHYAKFQDLQRRADAAEAAGNIEEAKALDQAAEQVGIKTAEKLTGHAQVIQFAHVFSQKSPNAMVRWAQNLYDESNKALNLSFQRAGKALTGQDYKLALTPEKKDMILQRMRQINKMSGEEKIKATQDLMREIGKDIPPSILQLTSAYRYQNMLINPLTQLRNIYSNLVNSALLRPATIGVQGTNADLLRLAGQKTTGSLMDVPRYYKGFFGGLANAAKAFEEGFAGTASMSEKIADTVQFSPYSAVTTENLPKPLTLAGRMLEGADRFFTELIANAEYAVNKAHGLGDEEARKGAYDSAARYLYRRQLDPTNATKQGFVSAKMDKLTDAITGFRKNTKWLGSEWFVPFVRVPMQVAKMGLEYNPITGAINLIGNSNKAEQIAKMEIGGAAMAYAAIQAAQGKTTWAAPTDPKQKQAFYDSGRKPFSIMIGDKWVPMTYFGPLAYAMALPVAAQYYQNESRTASTDSTMTKLGNVIMSSLNYFSQTTPMSGLGGFVQTASGSIDPSIGSNLGFTAGQAIPLNGLITYVNSWLDPVYRKSSGFVDQIEKGIPVLSQNLEPYTNSEGDISKKPLSSVALPYTLGSPDNRFESDYQLRTKDLQANAVKNKEQKDIESVLSKTANGNTSKMPTTQNDRIEKYILGSTYNIDTNGLSQDSVTMLERSRDYNYIEKLQDKSQDVPGLGGDFLQQEMQRKGISEMDLTYDKQTALPADIKVENITDAIDGMSTEDMFNTLASLRKVSEGTRKMYLTNDVINTLNDNGVIDDTTAKALKAVKYSLKDKQFSIDSGANKPKKSDLKLNVKTSTRKPTKLDLPSLKTRTSVTGGSLKKLRSSQVNIKQLIPKVSIAKPQTQAAQFKPAKISPRLATMTRSISKIGRVA